MAVCILRYDFSRHGALPSDEVQDDREVIDEQHPIAEGKPAQAALG